MPDEGNIMDDDDHMVGRNFFVDLPGSTFYKFDFNSMLVYIEHPDVGKLQILCVMKEKQTFCS